MNGRMRWPRAFTLTETIIVIAIVGLVLALLLPVLRSHHESLKRAGCVVHLKTIGAALHAYAADHNGELPYYSGQEIHFAPLTLADALVGVNGKAGYLAWTRSGGTRWSDRMHCPSDPNADLWKTSLGYSRSYMYRQTATGNPSENRPMKTASQGPGPRRWLVVDRYGAPGAGKTLFKGTNAIVSDPKLTQPDNRTVSSFWHRNGSNVLYEDGAVSWKSYGEALGR